MVRNPICEHTETGSSCRVIGSLLIVNAGRAPDLVIHLRTRLVLTPWVSATAGSALLPGTTVLVRRLRCADNLVMNFADAQETWKSVSNRRHCVNCARTNRSLLKRWVPLLQRL